MSTRLACTLPKHLDEEVAPAPGRLGVHLTELSKTQAEYLGVPVGGPQGRSVPVLSTSTERLPVGAPEHILPAWIEPRSGRGRTRSAPVPAPVGFPERLPGVPRWRAPPAGDQRASLPGSAGPPCGRRAEVDPSSPRDGESRHPDHPRAVVLLPDRGFLDRPGSGDSPVGKSVGILLLISIPWFGLAGWPILVAFWRGNGPVIDYGLTRRWSDLWWGSSTGCRVGRRGAGRGRHRGDLGKFDSAAGEIAGDVKQLWALVLFGILVGIGAPIAENSPSAACSSARCWPNGVSRRG